MIRRISIQDGGELSHLNIFCNFFGKPARNVVEISGEIEYGRKLTLDFAGDDNFISLKGKRAPSGAIRCLGDKVSVIIDNDREVNLDLWMYGGSRFYCEKPLAIYGLRAWVGDSTDLTLGEHCLLSEEIVMRTTDHHSIVDLDSLEQCNFPSNISIGKRCWIGQDVKILKGVSVGDGSILASGSVCVSDIPKTEVWGGVPARCIRKNVSWVPSSPANGSDVRQMLIELGINKRAVE